MGPSHSHSLFDSKAVRAAFITKVFTIVFVQCLIATAVIAFFTFHDPTKQFLRENEGWQLGIMLICLVVVMVIMITISCYQSVARNYPCNFVLLFILTIGFALIASMAAVRYETVTVLCAFGATAISVLVLVLAAHLCPVDLTTCGLTFLILGLVHFIICLILCLTLTDVKALHLIIGSTGALLVSLYMIMDVQLIMGGRTHELSPEDYVLGAMLLYADIINLFMYMLMIFGAARD